MRRVPKPLAIGGPVLALALLAAPSLGWAQAAPPGRISLLQTLAEWKYPNSDLSDGAEMSDGGNPRMQSVKCKAVLTTPDPIEKVVAFYEKKFKAGEPADPQSAKSVAVQDDSKGRPVTLRVFVVNRADTSTTLAISRAEGEKETHIAWSHYIRLGGER